MTGPSSLKRDTPSTAGLHAPAVTWPVRPPRAWGSMVAAIWLVCLGFVALGWHQSAGSAPSDARFMGLLVAGAGLGLWCAHQASRMPGFGAPATLAHNQGEWHLAWGAEITELLGEVHVHLDWQSALLVHFKNQHRTAWLWLDSPPNPSPLIAQQWIALRSALFAPSHPASHT